MDGETAELGRAQPARPFHVAHEPVHSFLDRRQESVHFRLLALDFHAYPAIRQILGEPGHIVPPGQLQGRVAETHSLHPSGVVDGLVAYLAGR